MSSYFDTMAGCVENPKEFVRLVRRQYRWYLRKLGREVLVRDLERLHELIREFDGIKDRKLCQEDPAREIQEMHTLAHKLVQAGIRLRGRQKALDNPPIPY